MCTSLGGRRTAAALVGCSELDGAGSAILPPGSGRLTIGFALASLDREIDRLYALPLDECTARRNELAKRLKKDGADEAAEHVTALVKPTVPAWTINQLARRQKKEVQAFLATGTRLRKAQERALAGGGADALRTAQAEERESVRELMHRASAILEEAGRPPTRAVLERIRATLGAAVLTDPER